jgi:hypothetical protein
MASRDDFEMAKRRAKELEVTTPRVVSAHYDRKVRRIVVHLSSKLIVSFSPGDVEGLEDAIASTFRLWMRIFMCRGYWKAFWVRGPGWRPGWGKLAASRGAKRRRPHQEQTENSVGGPKRQSNVEPGAKSKCNSYAHFLRNRGRG